VSGCGVILCECNGALERRISLQELSDFIHSYAPDMEIVTGDNLCKHQELNHLLDRTKLHPTIIAACDAIHNKSQLWNDVDTAKNGICFTKVIDLLGELSSDLSDAEVSERVKLILASQISKAISCSDISQDNIKLGLSPSNSDISRRNLFNSLLPHYEIIPAISQDDCLGSSCKLCAGVCPAEAIVNSENGLSIDKSSCTGCGACVNSCPIGAISYPGYSTVELEREIECLLSKHAELPYRIIAFHCQSCANVNDTRPKDSSPSLFDIKVPSPAIISPLLLLNAFNMGADGIVFIHNANLCTSKMPEQHLCNTMSFVQKLLDRWGIDINRIGCIDSANPELSTELSLFADNITKLGHTPFKTDAGSMTFEGMYSLSSIIKEMDAKLQVKGDVILYGADVPFGVVNIDEKHCSGCSVCAQSCPTGAISSQVSGDPLTYKLVFQHSKCVACGICTDICPEKCLSLRKELDFVFLQGQGQTIFDNKFVYCDNCGKPYATESMIEMLRHKLENAGALDPSWIKYCPSCRVAIQQKR
jgi:ferredoxin